jgi:hypothetical protein
LRKGVLVLSNKSAWLFSPVGEDELALGENLTSVIEDSEQRVNLRELPQSLANVLKRLERFWTEK